MDFWHWWGWFPSMEMCYRSRNYSRHRQCNKRCSPTETTAAKCLALSGFPVDRRMKSKAKGSAGWIFGNYEPWPADGRLLLSLCWLLLCTCLQLLFLGGHQSHWIRAPLTAACSFFYLFPGPVYKRSHFLKCWDQDVPRVLRPLSLWHQTSPSLGTFCGCLGPPVAMTPT